MTFSVNNGKVPALPVCCGGIWFESVSTTYWACIRVVSTTVPLKNKSTTYHLVFVPHIYLDFYFDSIIISVTFGGIHHGVLQHPPHPHFPRLWTQHSTHVSLSVSLALGAGITSGGIKELFLMTSRTLNRQSISSTIWPSLDQRQAELYDLAVKLFQSGKQSKTEMWRLSFTWCRRSNTSFWWNDLLAYCFHTRH